VPIDLSIREGGDSGQPLVAAHPDSPQTKVFQGMATTLKAALKL
jgi:ATP-binding protein involved in chromosome partitioning